ncbi:MAG: putative manganese-dependent inorganic diphosphatase [Bacilli bacterium]|nr:putative manganese-dependent inorganic diphosphatase [Bacilli bacterium]
MNKKTFVFGHKKPDTDAITASITLSYLKNQLGDDTEPRALGSLNKETKYALKYFNVQEPKYLNDVKLQLKDINYHRDFILNEKETIYDGYQYMIREGLTGVPIVKDDNSFVGLLTIKDLSKSLLNAHDNDIHTSYENIIKVLDGEEVIKCDEEIKGKLLVSAYSTETFKEKVELDKEIILIVGDRQDILEYSIKEGVLLIVVAGNGNINDNLIDIARKNKVNIIKSPFDSYHISKLISLSSYLKTMVCSYNPTKFEDTDYVDTVLDVNNKLRHTNYPVVDKDNKCLGLLRITDLNDKSPKKVILVDHSEKLQSADGIEQAKVVEIVDHHNIGSITTDAPINYRNMAVGSSNTVIYTLYEERNVEIPKDIAGMMLSGILSDTLILKSPTTTDKDREAVEELSKIAQVNYQEYGLEMLKAGTSLEGMSIEDVLYNDYKLYTVGDKTFAVGQFFTMNFEDINKDIDKYIKVMNDAAESNNYSLVVLYVTDIIKNGSYIIFNDKGQDIINQTYDKEIHVGDFIDKCVSRKKNVIPLIMDAFEN